MSTVTHYAIASNRENVETLFTSQVTTHPTLPKARKFLKKHMALAPTIWSRDKIFKVTMKVEKVK